MRVTIDMDSPGELRKLATYFNLKHICGVDEIRVSASGRGLHLFKRGLPITYEDSLLIREMLGDDPMRLRFDEEKNQKPKQILWCAKVINGERHEARTITERELLRLPFLSKIHGGWYKWKRG